MYQSLEKKIGLTFKNKDLLKMAFIHRSYMNEHKDGSIGHNERLEFLGDAVLELVVTEYLYIHYPDHDEGEMTNWRSALVKGNNLANVALELDLGKYLSLSKGEEKSGGREKPYILANTVEALIGAIYLDQGYEKVHGFIHQFITRELESIIKEGLHIDAKSLFQEISQERLSTTPIYKVLEESGPDHEKHFLMGAYLSEELIGEGEGTSKQKAEEEAAKDALKNKNWKK
ncbi:MAG: ribonuclease III [Patescibacteria group bacterium]